MRFGASGLSGGSILPPVNAAITGDPLASCRVGFAGLVHP